MNIIDSDLLSMQEARILVENAREAQKKMATIPQEKLDEIVERMIEEIEKHIYELAKLSNEETDCGKWEDKYIKNKFICKYLKNNLKTMKCVGIINRDEENKTMDIGVPVGVIIAFLPYTSAVSTTIYKALIAIKSGNAMIFYPNPVASKTISRTLDILIKAAEGYGLPEGALRYLTTISKSGAIELMNHKDSSLIMNTAMPSLLEEAYKSGKSVIYGGNGNGPAFIERTADIKNAVENIIASKFFDYGVLAAAEQSIVVDSVIEVEVRNELIKSGAYFMNEEESKSLGKLFFKEDGSENIDVIGKSAQELAKKAGFHIGDEIKVLISKEKFVSKNNPYSKEKKSPVLAYYIEDDWINACEKCIELLLSEKNGHTLIIHSKDSNVINQFALKKPVGRILVNTAGVFGSMGATTNLFPAMTLGSGSAGKGMTSDNVSPMNLIYIRKVGYPVRDLKEILEDNFHKKNLDISDFDKSNSREKNLELESLLKDFMEVIKTNK